MLDGLFPNYRAPALRDAVDRLAWTDETERRAVYTKPEIVRAILDLAGYTPDLPLHKLRLLEPSPCALPPDFDGPTTDAVRSTRTGGIAPGSGGPGSRS